MLAFTPALASLAILAFFSAVSAHKTTFGHAHGVGRRAAAAPELQVLFEGNAKFRSDIEASDPGILKKLTDDGQAPPFMFLGCSDSRVSEGTIFNAKPGTLFTERNIANQFHTTDANAHSVMSYAVSELGVKHIIVMGHYGCGGVAAAIASPPSAPVDAANGAVQNWIEPIRAIFQSSTRAEIVELREKIKGQALVEEPEPQDPGFRALVEENVKASVRRIATDSVISNHFALLSGQANSTVSERAEGEAPADVFVHGWVYDIENGEIKDLQITVGPPGKELPQVPFPAVNATSSTTPKVLTEVDNKNGSVSTTVHARCEEMCKAKRHHILRRSRSHM